MRSLVLVILLTFPLVSLSQGTIEIRNARVNAAPPGVGVTAGYLEIFNPGLEPVVLTKVSSREFGSVEIHRSIIKEGIARMLRQDSITIPSNSTLVFKPGDYHLMLFRPVKALQAGDVVSLNFTFENNITVEVSADITKPGGGHDHHENH